MYFSAVDRSLVHECLEYRWIGSISSEFGFLELRMFLDKADIWWMIVMMMRIETAWIVMTSWSQDVLEPRSLRQRFIVKAFSFTVKSIDIPETIAAQSSWKLWVELFVHEYLDLIVLLCANHRNISSLDWYWTYFYSNIVKR